MEDSMFAVTGITGKVGGTVADSLLKAGLPVRAIVRDKAKGAPWAARGA
jgi:NAD(P)H dehydrogenase (quinone)